MNKLSINYLDVPLHWKKLNTNHWEFLISKIEKKLQGWKEKLLSLGGKVTLIKSVLCAIPLYWTAIFRIPTLIRKRIEQSCRRFLWFRGINVRKKFIVLLHGKMYVKAKSLGIMNIKIMNKSLLCKLLWKYYNFREKGYWKEIIVHNYNNRRTNISPFWKEVRKKLNIFLVSINKKVDNGQSTLFWHDKWLLECSLNTQYPLLYELANNTEITLAQTI
jgi:hypothetical protein